MSVLKSLKRSREHIAKIKAFQTMFCRLETGLKHEVRTLNSSLYSAMLIGDETLGKADITVTLREVKAKIECNEKAFEDFTSVLSGMTLGKDLVRELRLRFDEELKMSPEESVDSKLSYTKPHQVTQPISLTNGLVMLFLLYCYPCSQCRHVSQKNPMS